MKNAFFSFILALCLVVTSSAVMAEETWGTPGGGMTTAGGDSASKLPPGCKPEFFKAQKGQADAQRALASAHDKEAIRQPDSVLSLTCYDQGLKQTSQLGKIFSDVAYSTGVPSLSIWGLLNSGVFSKMGAGGSLGSKLGSVVVPQLGNFMGNFGGSLTSLIGGALGIFPDWLGGLAGSPSAMNCTRMTDVWGGDAAMEGNTIKGRGPLTTIPYVLVSELLSGVMGSGLGSGFLQQLTGNSSLLNGALSSMSMFSAAPGGAGSFMRSVPTIPPGASVSMIINLMK